MPPSKNSKNPIVQNHRELEPNNTVPESEIMLSVARSQDGLWSVVIGERRDGREDVKTKGWGSRKEALAELARMIPRIQAFLTRSPKPRVEGAGVEAQS